MLHPKSTINCRGRIVDLKDPIVMGILNVTPDSFYDGGKFQNEKDHTELPIHFQRGVWSKLIFPIR